MTIYVDPSLHFWRGRYWCHLFTDGPLEELHAFAQRLGLKRSWFQQPPKASWEHYDISSSRRDQALRLGAVQADRFKALEISLARAGRLDEKAKAMIARARAARGSAGNGELQGKLI